VLLAAFVVSFADRQVITLLVEPIKADLGINDTQVSLLMGFAFSIFYVTMGVPIARLADRYNRRTIIAVGVFFWSVATVSCGLARSFGQLFLGRVAVGVGEAALTPAAYSIIADTFPEDRQGRAIAVYSTGIFIGSGMAMVLGGALIPLIQGLASELPAFLQQFRPWQLVFFVVGAPGVLLALLIRLTVTEPERKNRLSSEPQAKLPVRTVLAFIWKQRWSYFPIFLGYSLGGIGFWSYLFWVPELLRRRFGMEIGEAGTTYGLILTVFGTLGVLLGGWACDRVRAMGYRDASLRLAVLFCTRALPALVITPLVPGRGAVITMLSLSTFLISLQQALSPVALQLITPNEMRAQVVSLFLLVASFSSIALGASSVAIVTDYVFGGEEFIYLSMSIVSGVMMSLAVLALSLGLKSYKRSAERAGEWTQDI
jgi:MFS family permease